MSAAGIVIAVVMANFDYHLMCKLWKFHLPLTAFLVVLTFFIGIAPEGTDDKAWLDLGFTTLQPSELLKLSFILTFAMHLAYVKDNIRSIKTLFWLCVHGLAPTALIVLQGDLGSAIIFMMIFLVMIFAGGLPFYYIAGGLGAIAVGLPLFWKFWLPDYLKARFTIALHPELDRLGDGYQQYLGKVAIGSGQLTGRGLFNPDMYSVPECYNDFIFSFIGHVRVCRLHAGDRAAVRHLLQDAAHRNQIARSDGVLYLHRRVRGVLHPDYDQHSDGAVPDAGHRRHAAVFFVRRHLGFGLLYRRRDGDERVPVQPKRSFIPVSANG